MVPRLVLHTGTYRDVLPGFAKYQDHFNPVQTIIFCKGQRLKSAPEAARFPQTFHFVLVLVLLLVLELWRFIAPMRA